MTFRYLIVEIDVKFRNGSSGNVKWMIYDTETKRYEANPRTGKNEIWQNHVSVLERCRKLNKVGYNVEWSDLRLFDVEES